MRSLICRFHFTFFAKEKSRFLDVELKDKLFKLSNEQIQSLRDSCQGQECQDEIVKGLHKNIILNIPRFTSFFAVKSIMYYYLQNECNNQDFWKLMGIRLHQLLKENKNFTHPLCLGQLVFILGQLKRKKIIQTQQEHNVYKQCSNLLIERIPKGLKEQSPQNITHILALINQYQIEPQHITRVTDALLNLLDYSKFSIFDIHYLLWSLCSGHQKQISEFGILFLENRNIIDKIKFNFHQLKEEQQAKMLIALGFLRFNDKECIEEIVKNMKIFNITSLLSLMSKYLKNPMHQLNSQYPIIFALKEQFDEYFLMEDKDLSSTITGIKFLLYIPSQINSEVRQQFLNSIVLYENFILNNIEHFTNESLIDILSMASLFNSEKLLLKKVQSKIQNFNMNLQDSVSFLYCIQKYSNFFHQQINDCLTALINIHSHEIQTLNVLKHTQFYIALQLLEDEFPLSKVLLPYLDEKKILHKLFETVQKDQTEKYLQNFQFKRQFKHFSGFMENNFEYNLFLFEKQGFIKYIKESRIGCYLIDFRIWDVNLDKLNIQELKQMQKNIDLQTEFLETKQNKYDDITIDRKDEQQNIFIEIDGACHYDIRLDLVTQTQYKKKILQKYQINLKSIALNDNRGISNSLQVILDIFGK